MIPIKSQEEVEIMRQGRTKLQGVMTKVLDKVKPGVTTRELDSLAESLIKSQKGTPSFKEVKNYKWASCININEGVVHGIPGDLKIKKGDLVSVDIGLKYRGFHTDMARTLSLNGHEKFLAAGRKALERAKKMAVPGNRIGHISLAIEEEIKKAGFNPVLDLTGHGIGRCLHEVPQIPMFLKGDLQKTQLIKPGMVLAIEVIYAEGCPDLVIEDDGWTIKTKDGSLGGLFEDTVAPGSLWT